MTLEAGSTAVGTVPEIVPANSKNQPSRANSSQFARSRKVIETQDLRGKTKMAEMLIGVSQTAAFGHSATSPQTCKYT
jgi:hypothetical protein